MVVAIIEAKEKDKVLYTVWKPVSSITYMTMAAVESELLQAQDVCGALQICYLEPLEW